MSDTNATPATAGKTATATIFFRLSPAGQKAAMLSGFTAAREQSITGLIDAGDLDLCMIAPDGALLCAAYPIWARNAPSGLARYLTGDERSFCWGANVLHTLGTSPRGVQRNVDDLEFDAAPASAAYLMAEIRAKVAAIKAQDAAEAARRAEAERERNEARAATTAAADRKKAAEAALEQAKTDAIAAWVAGCGDTLLQQQYTDGLLARKDVVSLMAAEALDAAGLPAESGEPKTCQDLDCPCGEDTVATISTEVYARWKTIGPLPEGSTVKFLRVREHFGSDDGNLDAETAGPVEYHALVTVLLGPFRFTRRIKL